MRDDRAESPEPSHQSPGDAAIARDGRVVHVWNTWYKDAKGTKSRFAQFSISSDDGLTWSEPQAIAHRPDAHLCEPGAVRSPDGRPYHLACRDLDHLIGHREG